MGRVWHLGLAAVLLAAGCAPHRSTDVVVVSDPQPIHADDVYVAPKGAPAGYGAGYGAGHVRGSTALAVRSTQPVGCYPGAPTLYRGTLYCID